MQVRASPAARTQGACCRQQPPFGLGNIAAGHRTHGSPNGHVLDERIFVDLAPVVAANKDRIQFFLGGSRIASENSTPWLLTSGKAPISCRNWSAVSFPYSFKAPRFHRTPPVWNKQPFRLLFHNLAPKQNAVQTPLTATATSVGTFLSGSTFLIPPFQREYSWEQYQVSDFWTDLRQGMRDKTYFLGLIIVYEEEGRKHVVDGQQRILSVTLLAAAIYHEAKARGRVALAERVQADFLRSIDYATDETHPRVVLSDDVDNRTFQEILSRGEAPHASPGDEYPIAKRLVEAFEFLRTQLREDLKGDAFKRLGAWTDFLTNRLYVATFVHPNPSDAYRVYEVVNTRGADLSTADLLKNHVLSLTPAAERGHRYHQWQQMARQFESSNSFVQFIRHVVTVQAGHVLPQDLFDFLANRKTHGSKRTPPSPSDLIELLEENLPLYLQMIDPTLAGPANEEVLKVFAALRSLQVIAVRPILLAMFSVPDAIQGMHFVLQLVVRRMVSSNLGTGNVERRFGEIAKQIREDGSWAQVPGDLRDLNPPVEDFVAQLSKRSYNKQLLAFVRRSIVQAELTPDAKGTLHFIMPKHLSEWEGITEEEGSYWASTIGNTFLSELDRRALGATDWQSFKRLMLPTAVEGEWRTRLESIPEWTASAIESIGRDLAEAAGHVWY